MLKPYSNIEGSAAILFLRNDSLGFSEVGEMGTRDTSVNDGCRASCVDWYGNAWPLFIRNRVFALLGYEIVEVFRVTEFRKCGGSTIHRGM